MATVNTEDLADTVGSAISSAEYSRGGDWTEERDALKALVKRSEQLDQLIEAVELRLEIAAAYCPSSAERRRLGAKLNLPGTPVMGSLRRAANRKLEAVLATCKAGDS